MPSVHLFVRSHVQILIHNYFLKIVNWFLYETSHHMRILCTLLFVFSIRMIFSRVSQCKTFSLSLWRKEDIPALNLLNENKETFTNFISHNTSVHPSFCLSIKMTFWGFWWKTWTSTFVDKRQPSSDLQLFRNRWMVFYENFTLSITLLIRWFNFNFILRFSFELLFEFPHATLSCVG